MQWPKKEPRTPAPEFCKFCNAEQFVIKPNGPHRELSCASCGRYLKFVNKDQANYLAQNSKLMEAAE
jgi:transcription elongation factor Elf1